MCHSDSNFTILCTSVTFWPSSLRGCSRSITLRISVLETRNTTHSLCWTCNTRSHKLSLSKHFHTAKHTHGSPSGAEVVRWKVCERRWPHFHVVCASPPDAPKPNCSHAYTVVQTCGSAEQVYLCDSCFALFAVQCFECSIQAC